MRGSASGSEWIAARIPGRLARPGPGFGNGRATELIAWRPLAAGSGSWRLGELAAGTTEWLRVSLQLPPDAPSRLADRPSIVMYRFTAE